MGLPWSVQLTSFAGEMSRQTTEQLVYLALALSPEIVGQRKTIDSFPNFL